MISYSVLFSILSVVLCVGMILYYHNKINSLQDKICALECVVDKLNKKDPYEDYRNAKGLLSGRMVKEARISGKPRM